MMNIEANDSLAYRFCTVCFRSFADASRSQDQAVDQDEL